MRVTKAALKAPIHLYRWTLKPLMGLECRHLPTCSEYGLEAIDTNGAWRGFWLTLSRVLRCNPWGSAGYDPPPDISAEHHPFAPWRYGRWTGRHIAGARKWSATAACKAGSDCGCGGVSTDQER
ncbi:MAG: membrane protein insertion efficiency factor YidD [Hyphomicrobiaceae bacterium]|nr:membrane protein insertion efficiency factor YidD [Hyphomicrobiaceae bacterium]